MKKIIDIILPYGTHGGVENVVNQVAVYLNRGKYKIRVIQFSYFGISWVDDSIEFIPIFEKRGNYNNEACIEGYMRVMKEYGKPDLVLAANWPIISYYAKKAVQRMGLNCRVASWVHSDIERYRENGFGGIEAMGDADLHLAINNKIKNYIQQHISGAQVYRVKNPVDFSRVQKKTHDEIRHQLVIVGRLSEEKRIELVIKAIAMTKEQWNLEVVGDGSLADHLKQYAVECGVENNIEWSNWDDPYEHYKNADFMMISSIFEGYPLTAIEANACGIPVISTPVGNMPEYIRPGVNGYLVPYESPEGIAEVLDYVSDGKLPLLKTKDCIDASKEYDRDIVLKEFADVIEVVLNEGM